MFFAPQVRVMLAIPDQHLPQVVIIIPAIDTRRNHRENLKHAAQIRTQREKFRILFRISLNPVRTSELNFYIWAVKRISNLIPMFDNLSIKFAVFPLTSRRFVILRIDLQFLQDDLLRNRQCLMYCQSIIFVYLFFLWSIIIRDFHNPFDVIQGDCN